VIIRDIRGKLGKVTARYLARKNAVLPAGKRIVSFSFDDFPPSSITNGARILEARGTRGTFYAALGIAGTSAAAGQSEMLALRRRGHEVGCHTFSHLDCVETEAEKVRLDCLENQRVADDMAGVTLRSFAYPFGELNPSSKRVVGALYDSARTVEEGINAGIIDLAALSSVALFESDGIDAKENWLQALDATGGWLIFYTHDVCDPPKEWGCSIQMLSTVLDSCIDRGFEVRTVGEVVQMCTP
jgi:peptidoglycan/xylan/chitin deacetylase (PgdA/CDA1 family)